MLYKDFCNGCSDQNDMINFFILLTKLSDQFSNNSIYLDFCGSKYNASYIYLNASSIYFDVKKQYKVNDTCDNFVVYYPMSDDATQKITSGIVEVGDQCNLFYYSFLILSVITFLIGLVLPPEVLCKLVRKNIANQLHAGNIASRIRTKL